MGQKLDYCAPLDFDLQKMTKPLAALEAEAEFADAKVVVVFEFEVEGAPATGGGISLHVKNYKELPEPLPKPAKSKDQPEESATDSAEYVGETGTGSDQESSTFCV